MNCTDKERESCQVEKRGCEGCYYNKDEIVEGEYVRINNDNRNCVGVGKVTKILNEVIYVDMNNKYNLPVSFKIENITKHSSNIIDLIGAGDYVNGYPVRRIANFNNELCNFDLSTMEWTPLKNIDVYYNILTLEQFEQNCYEVEEK